MFLRRLRDLPGDVIDFIKEKKMLVIGILSAVIISLIFVFNLKNYYCSILFFPDSKKTGLLYERRNILYGKNRLDRINKIVDELLLGPIGPKYLDIFPMNSRLLSSRFDNDVLSLNFNRETVMNVNWDSTDNLSIYKILLQCIVDTVCYHDRGIKYVKFYFDGKEYRYVGDYKLPDEGVKPDWKILKK